MSNYSVSRILDTDYYIHLVTKVGKISTGSASNIYPIGKIEFLLIESGSFKLSYDKFIYTNNNWRLIKDCYVFHNSNWELITTVGIKT